MMIRTLGFLAALTFAAPASAEVFAKISDRDSFVSAIKDRALTRFGIRLSVSPDGAITGRAFGRDVRGAWRWQAGYFCRDLFWGERDLGPNCQQVEIKGHTIRFTSDRGTGDFADLVLK